jgi:hypothetical protein
MNKLKKKKKKMKKKRKRKLLSLHILLCVVDPPGRPLKSRQKKVCYFQCSTMSFFTYFKQELHFNPLQIHNGSEILESFVAEEDNIKYSSFNGCLSLKYVLAFCFYSFYFYFIVYINCKYL